MKTVGDKVLISGHEYTLGKKLGGGVEGAVYVCVEKPDFVIKLINSGKSNLIQRNEMREHLNWLKNTIGANQILRNKLAIPKGLLQGDDVGYIMHYISDYVSLSKYVTIPQNADFVEWYKNNYKLKKRLQIASYMFNSLEEIHISGLLFTDLSPNNILVHPDKNSLVFIDTDNMRRKTDAYLSVLGTDGYMAPEIHIAWEEYSKKLLEGGFNKEDLPKSGKLSAESDVFSAAIIAFQLLTLQHPFVGDAIEDGTAEEESAALQCKTDYILHKNGSNVSSTPFVKIFDDCKTVTPKLKELFYKTFVDGKENPYLRPTAVEFVEAFDEALDVLITCGECGSECIYTLNEENVCWDCEEEITQSVILEIFNKFSEGNRDKLIAQILGDKPIDESEKNNRFNHISTVVLEENQGRFLYLRHFERSSKRSRYFAKVTLLDEVSGLVRLQILDTSVIPACYLIDRQSRSTRIPIDDVKKGQEFSFDRYGILFDVIDSRVGIIKTVGVISRK